jgi:hypothetical protein
MRKPSYVFSPIARNPTKRYRVMMASHAAKKSIRALRLLCVKYVDGNEVLTCMIESITRVTLNIAL